MAALSAASLRRPCSRNPATLLTRKWLVALLLPVARSPRQECIRNVLRARACRHVALTGWKSGNTQCAGYGSCGAQKKKKNQYIFSSQLRADQMPGPTREGQLICTLFLSMRQ